MGTIVVNPGYQDAALNLVFSKFKLNCSKSPPFAKVDTFVDVKNVCAGFFAPVVNG